MKRKLVYLMLALVLGICFLTTASAAVEKKPGDTFTVTVVPKGENVNVYVIALDYDAAVLENTGVTSGRKIKDGRITTFGSDLNNSLTGKTALTATFKVKEGTEGKTAKVTVVELQPTKTAEGATVDGKWSGSTTITVVGAAPVTDAPTTTAPVTDAPTTTAPVTEAPVTAAPTAVPTPARTWSPWKVRKAATCTAEGVEFRTMGTKEETRPIAKLAHKEGKWEVVRKATAEQPGLRVKKCTVGGEILKQEEIPFSKVQRFTNNTASSQGFYFRNEVKGLTKEWNMFTPIDVSADGEQNIPLIASNMYYIGNVKVVVAGGNVTVTYEVANGVKVRKDFLAILPDLASVTTIDPAKLADFAHAYGEPISIENDLKGDTKVLLYVRNNVDYADNFRGVTRFTNRLDAYTKVLDGLRAIMD